MLPIFYSPDVDKNKKNRKNHLWQDFYKKCVFNDYYTLS